MLQRLASTASSYLWKTSNTNTFNNKSVAYQEVQPTLLKPLYKENIARNSSPHSKKKSKKEKHQLEIDGAPIQRLVHYWLEYDEKKEKVRLNLFDDNKERQYCVDRIDKLKQLLSKENALVEARSPIIFTNVEKLLERCTEKQCAIDFAREHFICNFSLYSNQKGHEYFRKEQMCCENQTCEEFYQELRQSIVSILQSSLEVELDIAQLLFDEMQQFMSRTNSGGIAYDKTHEIHQQEVHIPILKRISLEQQMNFARVNSKDLLNSLSNSTSCSNLSLNSHTPTSDLDDNKLEINSDITEQIPFLSSLRAQTSRIFIDIMRSDFSIRIRVFSFFRSTDLPNSKMIEAYGDLSRCNRYFTAVTEGLIKFEKLSAPKNSSKTNLITNKSRLIVFPQRLPFEY